MKEHLTHQFLYLPWPRTSSHKPPQTFWLILFGSGRKWEQPVWRPVSAPVSALTPAPPVYVHSALSRGISSTGRSGHMWHWEDAATPAPFTRFVDVLLSTAANAQSSLQNHPRNSNNSAETNPRPNPCCFTYSSVHASAVQKTTSKAWCPIT